MPRASEEEFLLPSSTAATVCLQVQQAFGGCRLVIAAAVCLLLLFVAAVVCCLLLFVAAVVCWLLLFAAVSVVIGVISERSSSSF